MPESQAKADEVTIAQAVGKFFLWIRRRGRGCEVLMTRLRPFTMADRYDDREQNLRALCVTCHFRVTI